MQLIDMETMWQCETCFHHMPNGCDTWCDAGEAYRPAANKLKVIDPESLRPKGEWIFQKVITYEFTTEVICSLCNKVVAKSWEYNADYARTRFAKEHNFCPNCGADMRGEGDG